MYSCICALIKTLKIVLRYIGLLFVSLIPFIGFGHIRGFLNWEHGFIFYLLCYFLFGLYTSLKKQSIYKTMGIFFIPLLAYPVLLYFEAKDYYYPHLAPSIFLTGAIGYILGLYFLRSRFAISTMLALSIFVQIVIIKKKLPDYFFNIMTHSVALSHLEGKKLNFQFDDLDGNSVSSKYFKNKVVVLDFWFTGCEACVVKHREYEKLYILFKNNPNVVIASVVDGRYSSREETKSFLRKYKYGFKTFYDKDGNLSRKYNLDTDGYPVQIHINRAGKIIGTVSGFGLKSLWYNNTIKTIKSQL